MKVKVAKQISILALFIHDTGLEAAHPVNDSNLRDAIDKIFAEIVPQPERIDLLTPEDTGLDRWTLKYWTNAYDDKTMKHIHGRKYTVSEVRAAMPKKVLAYLDHVNTLEVTVP